MIEEFERIIATGGDPEQVRQNLINRANGDRITRIAEINSDFLRAEMILYAIQTEPRTSPAFAVARGIVKRLKKKYCTLTQEDREFRKQLWQEAHGKDGGNDEDGSKPDGASSFRDDGISTGSEEAIPTAVSSTAP